MITRDADGTLRPTSASLELRKLADGSFETGCSVDVQARLPDPTYPASVLKDHPETWGLAAFLVDAARANDWNRVIGSPTAEDAAHALIVPTTSSRPEQKRHFRELARNMLRWERVPGETGVP